MATSFKQKLTNYFGIRDRASAILVWMSFLLFLANFAVIIAFVIPRFGKLGFLRLHYTAALGIDWVDDWRYIFVFPALSLAVIIVNGWLAGRLSSVNRRLVTILLGVTVIIESFLVIGGALAVSLNG